MRPGLRPTCRAGYLSLSREGPCLNRLPPGSMRDNTAGRRVDSTRRTPAQIPRDARHGAQRAGRIAGLPSPDRAPDPGEETSVMNRFANASCTIAATVLATAVLLPSQAAAQ